MRGRLATGAALVAAVAIFTVVYLVSGSLVWSPLVAFAGAIGIYLIVDARTPSQVAKDSYVEDAEKKAAEVLATVREIRKLAREVLAPTARGSLEQACQYVPEILDRVRVTAPDNLFSSAANIGGRVTSLLGVVRQYLDIQRKPTFYKNPQVLQREGEEAFGRFTQFAFDSLQLVNQGDMAAYRANLDTVAPPKLPELG